jgi:hypothetical protein
MNEEILKTLWLLTQIFLFHFILVEAVIFKVYDIDGKGKVTFKDLLLDLKHLTEHKPPVANHSG